MNADTARPLLRSDITRRLIGLFFDVYNELGFGFLESVYQEALAVALRDAGLACDRERMVRVEFRGRSVGEFRPDLAIAEAVIVGLKVARTLAAVHNVQLMNYLRATRFEVGLLLNFGPQPQFRRFVFANERKQPGRHPRSSA